MSSESLKLELTCAPVRRIHKSSKYQPASYEVALMTKDGGHSFSFISKEISNESTDLHKLITQDLHNVYNIHTLSIQSLSVQGQPSDRDHIISIFFVVPTDTASNLKSDVMFINMEDLMEQPGQLNNKHEFLLSLDQWLHERHTIPFINTDLMFATGSGRYGTVGDIQQNVQNPLHSTRTKPLEDTLIISIDNPVFSDNKL